MGSALTNFIQLIVAGLVVGSVYALVGLGFVLIYKSTGILNFAQGEFVLLGAYICFWLVVQHHIPFIPGFILTFVFMALFGIILERLALRPMIGEPVISVIMLTIGLAAMIRAFVSCIWGTQIRAFPSIFPQQPLHIGPIIVSQVYVWTFISSLVLLVIFAVFFKFSRIGIAMRAVADDQQAALSIGINVKKVFAVAWSVSAVVSAIGGMLIGNINGINIALSMFGLKVFPAVILGGLDSVPGAIIGGLTVGVLENLAGGYLDVYFGGNIKEVAPFVILVIILMIKPYGLFGVEEIERV